MKIIKLFTALIGISLFLIACSSNQQTANTEAYAGAYWAKDNLDLPRVGTLLQRSKTPQEFETYLNRRNGVNNLDLNGDGYADYISVEEFADQGPYERGLSLYCRYGPDEIQDIATIVFYRDDPSLAGARILVIGDDNIYGDNVHYETNWSDRSVEFVSLLILPRDVYYTSPYYFDNYPADYVVYDVVDPPVYLTRVASLYPDPLFVYTAAPTFIDKVKIKSPNQGKHMDQIYAQLAKPTRQQKEFIEHNPRASERAKLEKPGKGEPAAGQNNPAGGEKPTGPGKGRTVEPGKPGGQEKPPMAARTTGPGKSQMAERRRVQGRPQIAQRPRMQARPSAARVQAR